MKLPDIVNIGSTHGYVHLQQQDGNVLKAMLYEPEGFQGQWYQNGRKSGGQPEDKYGSYYQKLLCGAGNP